MNEPVTTPGTAAEGAAVPDAPAWADDARWALVRRYGPYAMEQAELMRSVFRDPDSWTIEPLKEDRNESGR